MVASAWYILVFIAIPCQAYLDDCVRLDRLWTGFSPTDHLQTNHYIKLRAAQNTTNPEACTGDRTTQSNIHLSPLNGRDTGFRRYVSPSKGKGVRLPEDNQNVRSEKTVQNYRSSRLDTRYKLDFNRQGRYTDARRVVASDTGRVVSTTTRYRMRSERQSEERLTRSVDYRRGGENSDRRSEKRMNLPAVREVRSVGLSTDERNRRQHYERDRDHVRNNRNTRYYQHEPEESKGVSDSSRSRTEGRTTDARGTGVTRTARDTEYRRVTERRAFSTESSNIIVRDASRTRTERLQARGHDNNKHTEVRTAGGHEEANAFNSASDGRHAEVTRMVVSRNARSISEEHASVERRQTTQRRDVTTDNRLIFAPSGFNLRRFTAAAPYRNAGGTTERNARLMRESRLAESRSHIAGQTTQRQDVRRTLAVGSFESHRGVDVTRFTLLPSRREERREVARYSKTMPLNDEEYQPKAARSTRDESRVSASNRQGAAEQVRRAASHNRELSGRDNRDIATRRVIAQLDERRGTNAAENRHSFQNSRSREEEVELVRRATWDTESRHNYQRTIAEPRRSRYIVDIDVADHHSGNQRRTFLAVRSITATSRRLSLRGSQARDKRETVFRNVQRDVRSRETPRSSNSGPQRRVGDLDRRDDIRRYRNREDDGVSRLGVDARVRQAERYQDVSRRIITATSVPPVDVDSRRVSQIRNHDGHGNIRLLQTRSGIRNRELDRSSKPVREARLARIEARDAGIQRDNPVSLRRTDRDTASRISGNKDERVNVRSTRRFDRVREVVQHAANEREDGSLDNRRRDSHIPFTTNSFDVRIRGHRLDGLSGRAIDIRRHAQGTFPSETRPTSFLRDARNTESRRHTPNEVRRLPEAKRRITQQRGNVRDVENLPRGTRHDGRQAVERRLSSTLDRSRSALSVTDAPIRKNIAAMAPMLAVDRSKGLEASRISDERKRFALYNMGEDDLSLWDLTDRRHRPYSMKENHDFPYAKQQATKYNLDWISGFYSSFTTESCMRTVVSVGAAAAILWSSMNPKATIV
ncbi:uncharacterized protein LOC135389973 isoform X2 [Ornithodoros turicata]|uniref:uncharacterized protein LOC135389973 isoform X2 n=1 Tax=Ornithodoros turicata TaxID=34597 RepID=UPI0031398A0E